MQAEFRHQLQLYRDIYNTTVALADLCAGEAVDEGELDRLLAQRQALITQAARSQAESGCSEAAIFAVREWIEQIALFDELARQGLEAKRDQARDELVGLRARKKAGRAYTAAAPQTEGFFIDRKEN